MLGLTVQVVGRVQKSAQVFYTAGKKPKALELACKVIELGVDVESVDRLQQTPLF